MPPRQLPVDRRTEVRRSVNLEFESVDEFITEYVSNLSRSGVFIRSEDPLPVGTRVTLRFTVIVDDIETLEGVGEVVRVIRPQQATPSSPSGMGVVFIELTQYSRQLIERILVRR